VFKRLTEAPIVCVGEAIEGIDRLGRCLDVELCIPTRTTAPMQHYRKRPYHSAANELRALYDT
jgi:hypothetical protein